ncbi:hypothetical protein [Microbacterium sp. NPDC056569]|uniref:hypothetical protein n=1 Tax=Microbacterium sp. NPDC056569 TaxID=3345867 RepID=UPI00366AA7CE
MTDRHDWDAGSSAFDDAFSVGDELFADDESPDGGEFADETSTGSFDELPFANAFSEEIENVTASDWDVDADVLWGGAAGSFDTGTDPAANAFDFPA